MAGGAGNILKVAAPLALGLLVPGIGTAIGGGLSSLGMGTALSGYAGSALAGAGIGGLGSLITGQNPLQGALLGGIGGGIGRGLSNNMPSMFGGATEAIDDVAAGAAPIQGLGQISASSLPSAANQSFMDKIAQTGSSAVANTGVPQVTSGISDLMSSKYAVPALIGGASLLSSSGKQKPMLSPANRLPAHDVAALDREQQDVDPSVYYGAGGNRNHFQSWSPAVRMAAKGGSIRKYANGGEVPMGNNMRPMEGAALPNGNSKQAIEGIIGALAATANPNSQTAPIAPLQRNFTQVDPNVYYGTEGNRSYFSPVAVDAPNTVKPAALAKGGRLVQGAGNGTSDDIPAMLSDGEYVIPAAAVSALGNGSNKAGAKKLDAFKQSVMSKHYKGGKAPKSAGIGSYMRAA